MRPAQRQVNSRTLVATWCSPFHHILLSALSIGMMLLGTIPPTVSQAADQSASPTLGIQLVDKGAVVTIDGEIFTQYLTNSGNRPVLWPIIGPTEKPVTRAYPLALPQPGETVDHVHHQSLWFGYEGINGVNFWSLPELHHESPYPVGSVRHREFIRADTNGKIAILIDRNDYLNPNGEIVAHDERMWRFGCQGDARWIDCRIRLWSANGPLIINDTKEGAFAVRVAGTMKVDAQKGGKIVSSNGDENVGAWGKRATWVDYHGPIDGQTVGIAILAHPTSHDPMPRWHVRTYGLFAANPFGASVYTDGKVQGGLQAAEGESVTLRHQVFIHKGDHISANIAGAYERYKKSN